MKDKPKQSGKILARILAYFKPYKKMTAFTILIILLMGFLDVIPPKIIQYIIDNLLEKGSMSYLLFMSLMLFAIASVRNALGPIRHILRWKLTSRIINDLRRQVHFHVQRLSLSFFHNRKSGDIVARIVNDVNGIESCMANIIETVPFALMTLTGIAVIIFIMNAKLAIVITLPFFIIAYLLFYYSRRVRKLYKDVRTKAGDMNAFLFENIGGIKEVKAFTRENLLASYFSEHSYRYLTSRMKAVKFSSIYMQLLRYVAELGLILAVGVGGYEVLKGRLTPGELTAFLLYVNMYYAPIRQLSNLNNIIQDGLASGERIFELMSLLPEIKDPDNPVCVKGLKGSIEFKNVSFKYPGTEQFVLKNINLEIKPKDKVGIVGFTGGGKTSLISLIARFYECNEGEVLIDGINIKNFMQKDLRRFIGIVFQDPYLFNTTIEENIRFGNTHVGFEEIEKVTSSAQIHDFISTLPKGYNTIVGERGVKLSQGQKQRISIARTLLQNPPIFIFDEATSSVDNITEHQIQKALDNLLKDRTSIIIAHRFSTLKNVNKIVVIDNGEIVEMGTEKELSEREGVYNSLKEMGKLI